MPSPTINSYRRNRFGDLAGASMGTNNLFGSQVLPENFGFRDLSGYEEARRNAFTGSLRDQLATGRQGLVKSLTDTGSQFFQRQTPFLLEDLQRRGLSSSPTAVAQANADALKEIELKNQDFLNQYDTAAISAGLQSEQDALDAGLDLNRAELESRNLESQAAREEALARDLADQQKKQSIIQSLIGVGGTLGSNYLMSRMMGGGVGGAGSTAGGLGGGGGTGFLSTPIFGGGSSLSAAPYAGAGAPSSSLFPGGIGAVGTPQAAGLTVGRALGGAGLGYLTSNIAKNQFGGGNDVGAIGGTAIGTLLGGPLGGAVGGYVGTAAQRLGEDAYKSTQKSLGGTGASLLKPIVNPIGTITDLAKNPSKAIKSVSKSVKKVFCFDGETSIIMADGSIRPISKLGLGQATKGGRVESIRMSEADPGTIYDYKGVKVTGLHAVKENGQWIRVENSSYSEQQPDGGIVWSIVTSNHRIYTNGIEAADEHETDNYEDLTIDQSLDELNKQELVEVA